MGNFLRMCQHSFPFLQIALGFYPFAYFCVQPADNLFFLFTGFNIIHANTCQRNQIAQKMKKISQIKQYIKRLLVYRHKNLCKYRRDYAQNEHPRKNGRESVQEVRQDKKSPEQVYTDGNEFKRMSEKAVVLTQVRNPAA